MTVNVAQRLGVGTVPDGTIVSIFNADGSALPGGPSASTVSGAASFPSLPPPTAPNASYQIVVSVPAGGKGFSAHGYAVPGDTPTVYFTAVRAYISQALSSAPPVGFAKCQISTLIQSTGTNGETPSFWLPDGSYNETYSFNPGLAGSQSFSLGPSSSANLLAEGGYARLPSELTRTAFTARTNTGVSFIPLAGNWTLFPQTTATAPVNHTVLSPYFWLPNGHYIEYLADSSVAAGAFSFDVGPHVSSPIRNLPVSNSNGWLIGALTDLSGNPISGLNVFATDGAGNQVAITQSDSSGYYILETPPGVFNITINDNAATYIPAGFGSISLPVGQVETIDAAMTPYSGFQGHIVDADNNGISGLGLNIYDGGGNYVTTAYTDSNGNYYQRLPAGTYQINYGNGEQNFHLGGYQLAIGQVLNVSFQVILSGVIDGTVQISPFSPDPSNRPLPGARIDFYRFGVYKTTAYTDGNGNYSVILPVGGYTLYVSYPGCYTNTPGTTVYTGTTSPVNCLLQRHPATPEAFVQDNAGLQVVGVTASLVNSSGAVISTAVTNNQGYAFFGAVQPGYYQVRTSNFGILTGTSSVYLPCYSDSSIVIFNGMYLNQGGVNFVGRVTHNGNPVSGAQVTTNVFFFNFILAETHTDAGGIYRLNYSTGFYYLEIRADNVTQSWTNTWGNGVSRHDVSY